MCVCVCVCVCVCERNYIPTDITIPLVIYIKFSMIVSLSYLPTPLLGQDMTQGQFLSGV